MTSRKGINRYLLPKLFPIYGILAGYLVILIFRFFNILLYELSAFSIGSHQVTIADSLIVIGFSSGVIIWRFRKNQSEL